MDRAKRVGDGNKLPTKKLSKDQKEFLLNNKSVLDKVVNRLKSDLRLL